MLFALVTADMNDDARAHLAERAKSNPNDPFAAEAMGPHARWLHETQRRLAYRALWQNYFETHDVFLAPVSITAAFPHDHSEPIENRLVKTPEGNRPDTQQVPFWIGFATLAGLPSTVAPVGKTQEGLPVKIQIVGPMWETERRSNSPRF